MGHEPAQLMHEAGYFVTRNDRRWNVVVLSKISVNELDVGATHSTRLDLDEHLIWLNVRDWHVLENEAFVVLPDASCLHRYLFLHVVFSDFGFSLLLCVTFLGLVEFASLIALR
jgi:hypothetical protein